MRHPWGFLWECATSKLGHKVDTEQEQAQVLMGAKSKDMQFWSFQIFRGEIGKLLKQKGNKIGLL